MLLLVDAVVQTIETRFHVDERGGFREGGPYANFDVDGHGRRVHVERASHVRVALKHLAGIEMHGREARVIVFVGRGDSLLSDAIDRLELMDVRGGEKRGRIRIIYSNVLVSESDRLEGARVIIGVIPRVVLVGGERNRWQVAG